MSMSLITIAVLFSAAYADVLDVIEGRTSIHDVEPNDRIEILNELVERERTDLAMDLVHRCRATSKQEETMTTMKAAQSVLGDQVGPFELIADLVVGPQIDLDLDAIHAGHTVLIRAAMMGKEECVKQLIKANASTDKEDEGGMTALFWAASNGNEEFVKQRIKADKEDESGMTALFLAAPRGSLNV